MIMHTKIKQKCGAPLDQDQKGDKKVRFPIVIVIDGEST
jgi:hypothetical protein